MQLFCSSKYQLFSYSVIQLFLSFLLLTSCEKEVSDQLKGKWQLKTVEDAGRLTPVDTVWYNFQSESLFMYQIYDPSSDSFSHLYGYKTQPESHVIHVELFSWSFTIPDILPHTDWKQPQRTFTIDKVNRKQLILKSDDKTYTFDRY